MANVYPQGQSVRLAGAYLGSAGQAADPADARVRVRRPDGTVETYSFADGTLERIEDGAYATLITADVAGRWLYRFEGTAGDSTPVYQGYFDVTNGF